MNNLTPRQQHLNFNLFSKLPTQLILLFSVLALALFAGSCVEDEELSEPKIVYFNLDDSDNTSINLSILELDNEGSVPFSLVASVGYIDEFGEEDGGILLTMLPFNSRGDIFEPGPGWMQIKFNNEQEAATLTSRSSQNQTFLIFEQEPDIGTFKAFYFNEDTVSVPINGRIHLNDIDYSIEEGLSNLDMELDLDEIEVEALEPFTLNGNISYRGLGGDYGDSESEPEDEAEDGPDVPGGCASYNGPEGDPQWETLCRSAYQFACANQQDGVEATCANFQGLQEAFPGIPDCPYCN